MRTDTITILDTETTGPNPETCALVELAWSTERRRWWRAVVETDADDLRAGLAFRTTVEALT